MPRDDPNFDEIEEAHLNGEHFGNPDPDCPECEFIDNDPEAPDPW